MKTRDLHSHPDSPHPGDDHPNHWTANPYSLVFTAVGLFILIFGIALFLGWRQFETTRHNALNADKMTATLLAELILEHHKATVGILQSYAHRSLFIDAVKNKDIEGVHRHLSDLKKNAEIDLTFVTDTRGILWANFPVFPEAMGKDLSSRDWYKGISSHWKPYISTVFKLIVGDKSLAVAACVPIFDEKERVIGILANTQRLSFLIDAMQRVPLGPYTTLNVIDRVGKILYSNKYTYQGNPTDYRLFPIIEAAFKEKKQQIEIIDPQEDQEKRYLTVVPVGDIGWTVIVEISLRDTLRSDLRRFIETGAISFLLFLLIIFFLVYMRKVYLFKKTEELLHVEKKYRQIEEKYRLMFETMISGFALLKMIYDDEGNPADCRYVDINPAHEKLTGLKSSEIVGRTARECIPNLENYWIENYGKVDQTGEPMYVENQVEGLNRCYSVLAYRPEPGYVAVTFEDITDRKQGERELQEKNVELERFSYAISHDLKSPLVTVKTFLGYLERDMEIADTDQIKKDLLYLHAAADKMGQLLDELLRVGRVVNAPVQTTFRDLVDEALSAVAGRITAGGVEVQVGDEPVTLYGDRPRLVQIWQNLVDNAVKCMGDQSSPRIEIGAEVSGPDTIFFVRDNGIGIDPQYHDKVFIMFEKIDLNRDGTGMGLALIKRIVSFYNGTIWLKSDGLGHGVCFRFTLPGAVNK